jgi:protein-tyrosine phosphatase
MATKTEPGAHIVVATLLNLRDLGGWATADGGRIRHGVLYRSTALNRLAGGDVALVAALGLHTVFDLRTADERSAGPDRLPVGVEGVVCDVLADSKDMAPAQLAKILDDPGLAERLIGGGKAETLFQHAYRELVSLPSARAAYGAMWRHVLDRASRPALFHCTTGKDRAGWGSASILLLCGVSEDDVRTDFLLTNRDLLPALQPLIDRFAEHGGDPAMLTPVLGVEPSYLDSALDELRARHGTIEAYFADGLGIGPDDQEALRAILVEPY